MANSGKSSREAVQSLINSMDSYYDAVTEEMKKLLHETYSLGEVWSDPQYDVFANYIAESVTILRKELTVFKEASGKLQAKLNLYDK